MIKETTTPQKPKCYKCQKPINEFGHNTYSGHIFCYDKNMFNKSFVVCLECGDKMFNFMNYEK